MTQSGTVMNQLLAALKLAAPKRICTRAYEDFNLRKSEDLEQGIFCLVNRGSTEIDDFSEMFSVVLIGQGQAPVDENGAVIEEAEDLMLDEVRRFERGTEGATVRRKSIKRSMQIERPFYWVLVELLVGPLDLSLDSLDGDIQDFITFNADYDLAPPDDDIDATDTITLDQ